jgi:hypothetical protein
VETAWQPHSHRPEADYLRATRRICESVRAALPVDAAVLVVSKGDAALLRVDRTAAHFPQDADGSYPGHYPADSGQAVDQLQDLAARGFTHLVFPSTSDWWLTHYEGLARYLDETAELVMADDDCRVFRLLARRGAQVRS